LIVVTGQRIPFAPQAVLRLPVVLPGSQPPRTIILFAQFQVTDIARLSDRNPQALWSFGGKVGNVYFNAPGLNGITGFEMQDCRLLSP
jgi:hypothetical protein